MQLNIQAKQKSFYGWHTFSASSLTLIDTFLAQNWLLINPFFPKKLDIAYIQLSTMQNVQLTKN